MFQNKKKIINDPVYGILSIPTELIFDLIEHPYFQRLRRIRQLGLTFYVYPGATHTRFHHALGCMHLMVGAIEVLRSKGIKISEEEAEGVMTAILLHDIGHGPFSHALEYSITNNITHENLSIIFMERLNLQFKGKLSTAIEIFTNKYPKKFLHQLISGQLDLDRLDFLRRDSFYTGVSEGVIGVDRIIKMLNVVNDELVVDAKGIYSVEKFLISRRLMYWQVYLHKTVLSAEHLIINILHRAKELSLKGEKLFAPPSLEYFLVNEIGKKDFKNKSQTNMALEHFSYLDDDDILVSAKVWATQSDTVLSKLCQNMISRKLYKVIIQPKAFDPDIIEGLTKKVMELYKINKQEAKYFVFSQSISNNAYSTNEDKIKILNKSGELTDISESSDILNIAVLSETITKHFLCFPKEIG